MILLVVIFGVLLFVALVVFLTSQSPQAIDSEAAHEVEAHPDIVSTQTPAGPDPSDERTGSEGDAESGIF